MKPVNTLQCRLFLWSIRCNKLWTFLETLHDCFTIYPLLWRHKIVFDPDCVSYWQCALGHWLLKCVFKVKYIDCFQIPESQTQCFFFSESDAEAVWWTLCPESWGPAAAISAQAGNCVTRRYLYWQGVYVK